MEPIVSYWIKFHGNLKIEVKNQGQTGHALKGVIISKIQVRYDLKIQNSFVEQLIASNRKIVTFQHVGWFVSGREEQIVGK